MNAATKTALFLALLAAAGIGLAILVGGDPADDALPMVGSTAPAEPETAETGSPMEVGQQPIRPVARTEVGSDVAHEDFAQGVQGFLRTPRNAAPPATKVFLMESSSDNVFRQMTLANKGVRIPPVARTETDSKGYFALGVEQIDPRKRYEVRIASDQYVDAKIPNLTMLEGQWYDAGVVKLVRGRVMFGRVTVEGSNGLPVPNAKVMVKPTTATPLLLSPTPGREEGLVVQTDKAGSYRIENVPNGLVTIAAVAPSFAKIEKPNTQVDATKPNQVNFELPSGVAIRGIIIDERGDPVAGAKVDATALSAKLPASGTTRSDRDGTFNVIGLVDGPYMVRAIAPGFERAERRPVVAGRRRIEIVLEKQGSARIKVFDKSQRLLRRYKLTVKTFFPGQDQYGNTDITPKHARTDAEGIATVAGLDSGQYVFQVEAPGHAKAFSEPFRVNAGRKKGPLVQVQLSEGGKLEGMVVNSSGKPVAGVRVQTLPNHLDENPFTKIFRQMIPFKITQKTAKTDAKGKYKLTLLNPGNYQLKFVHRQFYDIYLKDNSVVADQTTQVRRVIMQKGTLVSGVANVDGKPAGQVKVSISPAQDPQAAMDPPGTSQFTCDAISDNQGRFTFGKRVPPGRYQVMAARQTLPNPLMQIADFHRTMQVFTLGGQSKYFLTVRIPSQ